MKTAAIALALLLTAGPGLAAGIFPYTDPDATAAGAEVYADNCASCHGAALEGEPDWRTRDEDGLLPAPPHDASGHTWHHPDTQLFMLTKYGVAEMVGGGYESNMMGFGDLLTDDEILQVLAFIKSTWPDEVIEMHNQINAQQ